MKINNIPDEQLESQLKYLKLLSKQYPSISSASAEIRDRTFFVRFTW